MKVVKGYFDFDWGQLHFRSAGADAQKPLLLMLHQSPLSSRNYERALPLLARDCRVFALDTPGFGGSGKVGDSWEVADYARVVWDVADRLSAERICLFGRATGAVFALEAALRQPARISRLILHGLPVYTPEECVDRLANYAPPYKITDDGAHLRWIWDRIHREYPWIGAEMANNFLKDFLAAGGDFATAYRAIWRYDLPSHVGADFNLPTLLIGGEADRIYEMHARATALLKRARSVSLPGVTDFFAEQEPERFAAMLLDFMAAPA